MTPTTISQFVPVQPGATFQVRENYPMILEFLKAYYEWMELDGNAVDGIGILKDQRNIDKTLDKFVNYFQYEFLPSIPNAVLADKRKLVKHIKDFYKARGSEKSYRLLFRILYNEDVDFYYPKTDILRASDGKWSVDTVIRCTGNMVSDPTILIGYQITGMTWFTTAWIENAVRFNVGGTPVNELYISGIKPNQGNPNHTFDIGETIAINLPNNTQYFETLFGMVTGATITNPGTGYKPDDIITITGGNQTGILSVDTVYGEDLGRVRAAGAANFPQPATIQLSTKASSVNNYYNNMFVEIIEGKGTGQLKRIVGYSGSSKVAILETNWLTVPDVTSRYRISLGKIRSVKVRDFGINYTSSVAANFSGAGNGNATGNITYGSIGQYAGRYVNTDGFLSADKHLEDSFFYQDYSYVLKATNVINEYRNIVKKLLHPASLALFGEVVIPSNPARRKTHAVSTVVTQSAFSGSLPTLNLVVQYSMLENLVDAQKVFDVSAAFPNGINSVLGALSGADIDDPTWISQGLQFKNNFVNASHVPINNANQTIVVVAKPNTLSVSSGLIGCIDMGDDSGVSGYQIKVNPDGSLTFRSQKMNGSQNQLSVSYPAGTVTTSNYFFAALRYTNNTLVGNTSILSPVQDSFGTDIDGSGVIENSRGYYIGTGGFHQIDVSSPLYGRGIPGSILSGIPRSVSLPGSPINGFFDGVIAYVLVYDRYLQDNEISDTYQFMKQELLSRGITLV